MAADIVGQRSRVNQQPSLYVSLLYGFGEVGGREEYFVSIDHDDFCMERRPNDAACSRTSIKVNLW